MRFKLTALTESRASYQDVLKAFGDQETLDYMNANWKSNTGNDESLWEHEFNKHVCQPAHGVHDDMCLLSGFRTVQGTCLSTLEPKCFNNVSRHEAGSNDCVPQAKERYSTSSNLNKMRSPTSERPSPRTRLSGLTRASPLPVSFPL